MEFLSLTLVAIAIIISLYYGIILIIRAFQVSVWWGLGYLFVPFVSLIFIVVHWQTAKDPFLKSLLAIPFVFLGLFLLPTDTLNH
jgi:hypothetical protein